MSYLEFSEGIRAVGSMQTNDISNTTGCQSFDSFVWAFHDLLMDQLLGDSLERLFVDILIQFFQLFMKRLIRFGVNISRVHANAFLP